MLEQTKVETKLGNMLSLTDIFSGLNPEKIFFFLTAPKIISIFLLLFIFLTIDLIEFSLKKSPTFKKQINFPVDN